MLPYKFISMRDARYIAGRLNGRRITDNEDRHSRSVLPRPEIPPFFVVDRTTRSNGSKLAEFSRQLSPIGGIGCYLASNVDIRQVETMVAPRLEIRGCFVSPTVNRVRIVFSFLLFSSFADRQSATRQRNFAIEVFTFDFIAPSLLPRYSHPVYAYDTCTGCLDFSNEKIREFIPLDLRSCVPFKSRQPSTGFV